MLELDLAGLIRFPTPYQLVSVRDDDEQPSLSTRVDIVEGDIISIKSSLDRMAQAIERISFKIDDRNLVDDTYRSERERSSGNSHP